YGKFMACSNFPDCRNTKPILKKIGVTCPTCKQGEIVERKSKKNRVFFGCERYPDCEFVFWVKPVGRNCPNCDEFLVEERTKKEEIIKIKSKNNRVVYECERYPDCEFVSWDKPVGRNCPKCDEFLVEKRTKKQVQIKCSNCDYKEEAQT